MQLIKNIIISDQLKSSSLTVYLGFNIANNFKCYWFFKYIATANIIKSNDVKLNITRSTT